MSNLNLWEDLNKLKETCKWVDLSHEVSPETPHWFGFPSVKSSVLYDFEKDGFRAHTYEIVSQYGNLFILLKGKEVWILLNQMTW